ncbi:MAG: hypothetical protein FJX57_23800 [Alphaproteobacteria bacterium]|nr:hypothetical protein [Alphaproteobacteria bacterium]
MDVVARVAELAAAEGLLLRGGFHPGDDDDVPALPSGGRAATVLLLGNAGPAMWHRFAASAERREPEAPLDRWTCRVITALAAEVGAAPLFPFNGPPHLPFQSWALRAEPVHVSPLRLLIHPVFGLWHAWRGALAFAISLALPATTAQASPCDACHERPCLSACPVDAFSPRGFAVDRCIDHVRGRKGTACRESGCLARHACPIGREYRYEPAQAAFHMQAFITSRRE